MNTIWHEYGFRDNPYSTDAIRSHGDQWKLLVGRDAELRLISRHLAGGASVVALEGNFGVGKTSLAAVAAHNATLIREQGGPLFIPTSRPLSLRVTDTVETFERRAFQLIAKALIEAAGTLKQERRSLRGIESLQAWLQTPQGGGWNAAIGANFAGFGGTGGIGRNKSSNTSAGFNEAGVIQMIDGWLTELFPDRASGGVICLIDNLEELGESQSALKVLEPLRDPLLRRNGLRWMVGGAQGIVRAAFSSPKMSGVFQNPIDVAPLPADLVREVIVRRGKFLSIDENASLPVSKEAFKKVYEGIGFNLRYSLNLAERFCYVKEPEDVKNMATLERDQAFENFVLEESKLVYEQYATTLTKADWSVFDTLLSKKAGSCSPSEFSAFGYANMSPLIVRVNRLAKANLVDYIIDASDQRRRNITATDHGRLAYYRHNSPR